MTLFSWCSVLSRPLRGAQLWVGALLLCLASFTVTAEETTEAPSWDNLTQALQLDPSESADRTSPLAAPQNDSAQVLTGPALPFMVDASFSDDTVHFTISMASGAYIYRDSIVLTSNSGSLLLAQPNLPEAIEHEDSMGTHLVYFDELQFDASILSAQAGDELTLSYQGCDAQGICYPPQNYSVELIKDVKVSYTKLDQAKQNTHSTTAPSSAAPQTEPSASQSLWSLLSTETEGSAISDFITQNLGIGLLLCFLLGIGLDLTPCVLPMLPIFSALIVSKPRGGKNVSFAILLRQNLGYALGLSLCYMVLGLIFAALGASFHGFLQHPLVTCTIAILLLVCAAACADLFELLGRSLRHAKWQHPDGCLGLLRDWPGHGHAALNYRSLWRPLLNEGRYSRRLS